MPQCACSCTNYMTPIPWAGKEPHPRMRGHGPFRMVSGLHESYASSFATILDMIGFSLIRSLGVVFLSPFDSNISITKSC